MVIAFLITPSERLILPVTTANHGTHIATLESIYPDLICAFNFYY